MPFGSCPVDFVRTVQGSTGAARSLFFFSFSQSISVSVYQKQCDNSVDIDRGWPPLESCNRLLNGNSLVREVTNCSQTNNILFSECACA